MDWTARHIVAWYLVAKVKMDHQARPRRSTRTASPQLLNGEPLEWVATHAGTGRRVVTANGTPGTRLAATPGRST